MIYKRGLVSLKAGAVYNELKRLDDNGTLPRLVSIGLLSPKANTYMRITEKVIYQQTRLKNTPNKVIICNVASEFKVSTATVYRAISIMRKPLHKPATK
jgi:hypothetical protein